jgi:single-stranded DNA-binding protein
MAFYLNQCALIGHLVADPELKDLPKTKVCKFRIAVNNPHNEKALFFSVDVWGKEGEKCMLLKKGAQVFITNAQILPKQYTKKMSNGEEFTCNTITINVDGYCGKVQFGSKAEIKTSNNDSSEKNLEANESEDSSGFEEGFEF